MISPQEAAKTKALKERLAAFQETTEAAKKEIMPELLEFFVTLGMEGERSSVVLGAERINVALEAARLRSQAWADFVGAIFN